MMGHLIPKLPAEWKVTGSLPVVDLEDLTEEELDLLTEDLVQATYGKYLLDIGYYPEANADGRFVCSAHELDAIGYDTWESPFSSLETRDVFEAYTWLAAIAETLSYVLSKS
jgi:hypothetical protein